MSTPHNVAKRQEIFRYISDRQQELLASESASTRTLAMKKAFHLTRLHFRIRQLTIDKIILEGLAKDWPLDDEEKQESAPQQP